MLASASSCVKVELLAFFWLPFVMVEETSRLKADIAEKE